MDNLRAILPAPYCYAFHAISAFQTVPANPYHRHIMKKNTSELVAFGKQKQAVHNNTTNLTDHMTHAGYPPLEKLPLSIGKRSSTKTAGERTGNSVSSALFINPPALPSEWSDGRRWAVTA